MGLKCDYTSHTDRFFSSLFFCFFKYILQHDKSDIILTEKEYGKITFTILSSHWWKI